MIHRYIEDNYDKNITLTHLSKELGYSVPYLSKKFKEDFGISPSGTYIKKDVPQ